MTLSIDQADAIHLARGNAAWEDETTDADKQIAITRAEDYVLATYRLRAGVEEDDERLLLALSLLALQFLASAPALLATKEVRAEELASDGSSLKTTFADAPADPYPLITRLLAPLTLSSGSSGISFAEATR